MCWWQRMMSGVWASALLCSVVISPVTVWAATETGGYPWADASLVRAASYDWGYTSCQPAMRAAQTCGAHITTKLGQKYYESDPWRYDVRNCTSYVAWRMHSESGIAISGWGNANHWDTAAKQAGYAVNTHPARGSIAQWEGAYGHVAYVVAVNPDQTVNVEQYNKAGTGEFSRQSRVRADYYIHVADKPDSPSVAVAPATVQASVVVPQVQPVASEQGASVVQTNTTGVKSEAFQLQPLQPTTSLPATPGVSYQVALDPRAEEVNVYAVVWQNSQSGSVELYQSNGADGNTTWISYWQTGLPLEAVASRRYLVADGNADGQLDLYVMGSGGVQILDGAHGFKSSPAAIVQTSEQAKLPIDPAKPSQLQLADYDGDGSLDLFAISKQDTGAEVDIFDGSKQFSQPLAHWQTPVAPDVKEFMVGDHDRDGRVDVYQVGSKVTVLSAVSNYNQVLGTWKPDAKEPEVTAQEPADQ